ncbi:hypothetical protein B0H11DRAFT_1914779 [Mycena galericulata]|nr:hypothetical protein B0H11DRAFT_1914779 [Mycena galericulata]
MLRGLSDKKDTHRSGNGWKPSVWPEIVNAVKALDPEAMPVKDQTRLVSKLNYKFSGTGWDKEKKHATNTPDFLAAHGKKYAQCFKKPCPFYSELDELYDGLKNRATGEHVVHFTKKRKSRGKPGKENPTAPNPTSAANPTLAVDSEGRPPTAPLNSIPNDADNPAGSQRGMYDDELSLSPAKLSKKRTRSESHDDDADADADDESDKGKCRRHKSDSSSSSVARRNAEAGSQLARSVDNLSAAMLKPIVTTKDISYVDDVMHILEDATPPDPHGQLFDIVSMALTSSPTRARIFILAADDVRRKGIIKRTLKDAGVELPDDY